MKNTKTNSFSNDRIQASFFGRAVSPDRSAERGLSRILMQLSTSFLPPRHSGDIAAGEQLECCGQKQE